MADKLLEQSQKKKDIKLQNASAAYVDFLGAGGRIDMQDINRALIGRCLEKSGPVIAGLSSTWLYRCAREMQNTSQADDVLGHPRGHFVVLHGVDPDRVQVSVADPYLHKPYPGGSPLSH